MGTIVMDAMVNHEIQERIPTEDYYGYFIPSTFVVCMYEGDFEVTERYDYNSFIFTLKSLGVTTSDIGQIFWRLWKDEDFGIERYIPSDLDMNINVGMEL